MSEVFYPETETETTETQTPRPPFRELLAVAQVAGCKPEWELAATTYLRFGAGDPAAYRHIVDALRRNQSQMWFQPGEKPVVKPVKSTKRHKQPG